MWLVIIWGGFFLGVIARLFLKTRLHRLIHNLSHSRVAKLLSCIRETIRERVR